MASSDSVSGFRLAAVSAGIKTAGRLDTVLMEFPAEATVAAVFTQNAFCAAPVQVAKDHLAHASARYLLVNTGNANAGTGAAGISDAKQCCSQLAQLAGVMPQQVLPFSTGVIGEPLPVSKLEAVFEAALAGLGEANWEAAAAGIMTTDTRPKLASRCIVIDGETVTLTGITKGSGMIRPNMATMLAYVATDAGLPQSLLQSLWREAVELSFNRISIDGDTSTNDAAILVATGRSSIALDSAAHPDYELFADALKELVLELAQAMVRDGEGASKFVTVKVQGGRSEAECLEVAYTIAHSPLVKTALFASDPNWGRLLMAIGRADIEELDVDRVAVRINDVLIAEGGCRAASYTEQQGAAAMAAEDIEIVVELQRGDAVATVWTSDLSYDYVRINAEYRT
ncbi:bifunctional glutamate N-acetyltransferase/amino-acid acetyltransferase ArgJ [Halieaceae bacterium IMCC14734]|uniref:Arginine biosynthesis bifunctional protein ArgJ n=1 Tax=Candidatus Litorirhabdus singularis TaxID=2518993 RepID=A0ABT3TLV5_9GAMM|nr:bifunctional glutamate N-acetyltransferase/amino-acid acetyltransferase ArgJ [Candidatus Litorirhabdus singularis]MCX2982394.1 bifunctional glutamate N-acetyltransferase/amino-acid acetyltransferase ArgJ [Candidatus Litorirhabdus singularis]